MDTAENDYGADLGEFPLEFVPGRVDCPDSPYDDGDGNEEDDFPRAHAGASATFKYFANHFGLTRWETVS